MRKFLSTIRIVLLFILFCVSTSTSQSKYTGQSIEEILALPEDSIDLGIACLVLAKDAYPESKIEFFDYAIDFMVQKIRYLNQDRTDPNARIGLLNTYLFKPGWWNDSITFTYDLDDLEAQETKNQFLNGYIASKKGSCATMSMLYLVLVDRLGWPIKPVRSAKHIFCRYIQKGFKEDNIEATCGGGYISNEGYIKQVGIPKKAVKNGVYLRTLSKKEYLATLLQSNVRYFWEKKRDFDKAVYYCKLSILLDSTLSGAYWNLGELFRERAVELDSLRYERIQDLKNEFYLLHRRQPQEITPQSLVPSASRLMTMDERIESVKPKPPSPFSPQPNPYNRPMAVDPNIQQENDQVMLMAEIQSIGEKYGKRILALLESSRKLKAKAKSLGIVLKFPEEFFRKQAEAIEKFKRTGEY